MVHADLSEYNLLWHEGQVYFIDVSQAVDLSHPLAHEFLLRDCKNVVHYFNKHDSHGLKVSTEKLKVHKVHLALQICLHVCYTLLFAIAPNLTIAVV